MTKLPQYQVYGENNEVVRQSIQPSLSLRQWSDLTREEKIIALEEVKRSGWLNDYNKEVLQTIDYLNYKFLRLCPGRRLHKIKPESDYRGYGNENVRMEAALEDFEDIFINSDSSDLVLVMLSKLVQSHIDTYKHGLAVKSKNKKERQKYLSEAFSMSDRLSNCLNHIFEQFYIDQLSTRNGLIPKQDQLITEKIYIPTMMALADPKWQLVSQDLSEMFEDYRERKYPETITKAHRAVQRFLQILTREGKNGKGEVGKLFREAKDSGLIPIDRFSEPIVNVLQGFIPSERATSSTAKPATKEASNSDALLMMNVVIVFLQHCLQHKK